MDFEHKNNGFENEPSRESAEGFRPVENEPAPQDAVNPGWQEAQPVPPQNTAEPRTPYQTPVRPQAGTPHDAYAPQADAFGEAPQMDQPPYGPRQESYATYQEWMAQEAKQKSKTRPPRAARARRKVGRKPLLVIGSVAAACAIFVGGLAIGGAFSPAGNADSVQTITTNPSLPSLSISGTPAGGTSANADGTLSGAQIYEKVSPSVVSVQAVSLTSGTGGTGSGVIMSEDGYIITNNHVVVNEETGVQVEKVTVILSDGTSLPAEIVGRDEETDLAVLKVTTDQKLQAAEFGDSTALKPGEDVYAIGSPGGVTLANTITGGHISALNRDITISDRVMSLIQTDAAINPGNSGGALINAYGQVVGITSAKIGGSNYEGLGFAIPMDTAKEIVDQLIQIGYIAGRPQIGLSGQNLTERQAAAYDVPQGVLIASIDSRSNAAAAGVKANDIIIGVNGKDITTMDEVNEAKGDMKAGETITLKLYRMSTGKTLTVSFALNDQHDLEGDDPAQSQQSDSYGQSGYGGYGGYGGYNSPFSYFFGQ